MPERPRLVRYVCAVGHVFYLPEGEPEVCAIAVSDEETGMLVRCGAAGRRAT